MTTLFKTSFLLLSNIVFGSFISVDAVVKPHNLTILALVVKSGNGPKNGRACMTAQQLVLDDVNARSDILPEYNLKASFQDEGPSSVYSATVGVQFSRLIETEYISPITNGLSFTPGCLSFGSYLLPHINMVLLAQACLSPIFTRNRKQFPNLYRTRFSGELSNIVVTAYLKQNNWQKVAVYANSDNSYNTMVAGHFHEVAAKEDIEIVSYDMGSMISLSAVQSIKESGARIIIVFSPELPVLLSFLCFTYQVGLRGPRYAFIFTLGNIDPITLATTASGACTREMVMEQFERIVMVAPSSAPFENYGPTTLLGYDAVTYEKRFAEYSGNATFGDISDRLQCYDRMLTTVLALDRTEKKLAAKNLTLLDYRKYPKIIMEAANESVFESDVVALRSGRIKYDKYGEFTEANFVVTWRPVIGFKPNFKIVLRQDGDSSNWTSYTIQALENKIAWGTADGKPPRDFAKFKAVDTDVSAAGVITVSAVAGTSIIFKLVLFALVAYRKPDEVHLTNPLLPKGLFVIGCILLDGSAVAFALPESKNVICAVRTYLTACGFSIISGIFFFRMVIFRHAYLSTRPVSAKPSHKSHDNKHLPHKVVMEIANVHKALTAVSSVPINPVISLSSKIHGLALLFAVLFCFANMLVLSGLFIGHPPRSHREVLSVDYSEQTDTLTEQYTYSCQSSKQAAYYGTLVALNGAFLLASSAIAFGLRAANIEAQEKLERIAIVNTTTLLAATICIIFIIGASASQQIVVVSADLIVSFSDACLFLGPSVISRHMKVTNLPLNKVTEHV